MSVSPGGATPGRVCRHSKRLLRYRDSFINNLLVRIHFDIDMIWWTGLTPWEFTCGRIPFEPLIILLVDVTR